MLITSQSFFLKINASFPIFDETQFRRVYESHKDSISPALLAHVYAITLVFWQCSPVLKQLPCPEIYPIWAQTENAYNAEAFCTPAISTIITLLLNLSGRPSTHSLGNTGWLGTAVGYANAFGLNQDPSAWRLSPTEKSFRIRIWRLLLIYDRW